MHRDGGSFFNQAFPPPPPPMNWFCLHTKPKKESQIVTYLRTNLQLETYCPLLQEYRTIRRVRRRVVGPLFPRYVFCRFDPGISFRAVRYAPDIDDIVQFGGRPAVVADALVAELREWAGDALAAAQVQRSLQAGDRVEIAQGPLRGLTAIILHARDDADRVEILLTLLQHGARMSVHRDQLVPA